MFSFYLFRHYFLSARSNSVIKVVSWICFASLAMSLAALILIVSIMGGFGEAISKRITSNEAHLFVSFKPGSHQSLQKQQQSFLSYINKQEGIESFVFLENQSVLLKAGKNLQEVTAKGYPKKYIQQRKDRWLYNDQEELAQNDSNSKQVILSYKLLSEMNLEIGDQVMLLPTITLLFPPSVLPTLKKAQIQNAELLSQSSNQSLENENYLLYTSGSLNFGQYSRVQYGAEVKLHNPQQASLYKNELQQQFKVSTWLDRNSTLFFALKLEKFMMAFLIILAIIISCLGISSSLLLLITQKSKDIVILNAIGVSQKDLVKTFTLVGFYLSCIGIFFGAFVGILGSMFFKYNTWNILPAIYQDRNIPAVLNPTAYALIVVGILIVAWFVCYLPTKHLSRIKPANLLR